jgi:hypothetical protein
MMISWDEEPGPRPGNTRETRFDSAICHYTTLRFALHVKVSKVSKVSKVTSKKTDTKRTSAEGSVRERK